MNIKVTALTVSKKSSNTQKTSHTKIYESILANLYIETLMSRLNSKDQLASAMTSFSKQ